MTPTEDQWGNLSGDPVHQEGELWYFWDEVWCDRYGPYDSEKECKKELDRYCKEVLGI